MIIKCTLSLARENIGYYRMKSCEVRSLPEYITRMGPQVIEQGQADPQVITTYEFDESQLSEAWECISEQLDTFSIIPEFALSVSLLHKGREVKWYGISVDQGGRNLGRFPTSKCLSSPAPVARG